MRCHGRRTGPCYHLLPLLLWWQMSHGQPIPFTCQPLQPNTAYIVSSSVNCSSPIIIDQGAKLSFPDQDVTLVCPGIVIENGGTLEVGTETQPIATGLVQILLYGSWQDECLSSPNSQYQKDYLSCPGALCPAHASCGTTNNGDCGFWKGPQCGGPYGAKAIAVGAGGNLQMHGKKGVPPLPLGLDGKGVLGAPTTADPGSWRSSFGWAVLATTIQANTTAQQCLTTTPPVSAAVGWLPGDQVLLTTTDYEPGHNEEATLVACPGLAGCTSGLCIQQNLTWEHRAGRFQASNGVEIGHATSARVGLLSRNIMVSAIGDNMTAPFYPATYSPTVQQGQPIPYSTSENYYGMQVIARANASSFKIEGVRLQWGGQGGVIGRYAVHLHRVENGGAGMYVHGNAIVDSMTRAVVIHGTRYVVVSENVAWKSIGHMFYCENGDETLNAFVRNMGVEAISASTNFRYQPVDANPRKVPPIHRRYDCAKPSIFWSPNPYNLWIGNQAIGAFDSGSGYWIFNSGGSGGPSPIFSFLVSQHAPIREFSGNYAASSKFCFHSEGNTGVTMNSPYDCTEIPGGGGFSLNHLCIANRRDPDGRTDPSVQSWNDLLPFQDPGNLEPFKEPANPGVPGGNRFDWGILLIEDITCVRILSSQQFGVMWVRDFPSVIAGAVFVDNWGRGGTSVSGGSPLSASGAFYNAFFMDVTAVGISPLFPCTPRCCSKFDFQPGVFWPGDVVELQTSAINFYDGPTHMVNVHVENYIDGLTHRYCGVQPQGCGGDSQSQSVCQMPTLTLPPRPWWEKGPTTAFSWMLPNVQYYPVTFTVRNMSFTSVTNRHLALAPWSDLLLNLGNGSGAALVYGQLGISNLLTVLQDDDGSLTGQLGSTGRPIISTTSTRFLRSPHWRIECQSSLTCGVSPSEYMNFFVTPATDLQWWNNSAPFPNLTIPYQVDAQAYWSQYQPNWAGGTGDGKNVAMWRLSLRDEEKSVPGLGLYSTGFINGDSTAWGVTVANVTLALTFSEVSLPVKVWTVYLANAEENDFIDLLVPTTGSITALFGAISGDGNLYFYPDGSPPQTVAGVNGMAKITLKVPHPRKTDECPFQGNPFPPVPGVGSTISICGTRSAANPTAPCNYNRTQKLPNVFYENDRTSDLLELVCDISTEFLFEGMDYEVVPGGPLALPNLNPILYAVRLTGDFDPSFDTSRLPDFATVFPAELYQRDFVPNPNDPDCGVNSTQPITPSVRGVCPVNWKDLPGGIGEEPQWNDYICNRWDYASS